MIFRETVETGIIVAVLLAFLSQTLGGPDDVVVHKRLRRQVCTLDLNSSQHVTYSDSVVGQIWVGVGTGCVICLAIGGGLIGAFYGLKRDKWAANGDIWAGVFALLATIVITIMGGALLRVSKMQDKWRVKLATALEKRAASASTGGKIKQWAEKYVMFLLPFVTVMREGLEAIIFLGGVSVGQPASAFPLAAITGLIAGTTVSYLLYR